MEKWYIKVSNLINKRTTEQDIPPQVSSFPEQISLSTQTHVYRRPITANMNQTPILWINNSLFDHTKDFYCRLTHLQVSVTTLKSFWERKTWWKKHKEAWNGHCLKSGDSYISYAVDNTTSAEMVFWKHDFMYMRVCNKILLFLNYKQYFSTHWLVPYGMQMQFWKLELQF